MRAHFDAIAFRPSEFADFLLSADCGFVACHAVRSAVSSDAFRRRSMRVFVKGAVEIAPPPTTPLPSTAQETAPPTPDEAPAAKRSKPADV